MRDVKQTLTKLSCIFNMKFSIQARSSTLTKLKTILQKIKYKLPKTGSKMIFIRHFYRLLMKTSTQVQASHLRTCQMFGKMIQLSDFRLNELRCKDLQVLNTLFSKLGFTPRKAEQPLQAMELQKRKCKKMKVHRKSVQKERTNKTVFVNSRLNAIQRKGLGKAFYRQRIPKSLFARKETVNIDILKTYRNDDSNNHVICHNNEQTSYEYQ